MELENWIVLFLAGIFAGFVNTLAGGGSVVSLPVLMLFGLSPFEANATNRLGIVVQTFFATWGFRGQESKQQMLLALGLAIPACIGAAWGAQLSLSIDPKLLQRILIGCMLLALGFILWSPKKPQMVGKVCYLPRQFWIAFPLCGLLGIYGGFIQIGVGFFMILLLSSTFGFSLVTINALKVKIVFIYTLVAIVVFSSAGQIRWQYGAVLALGGACGGMAASHFSMAKGEKLVKIVLCIAVLIMLTKLTGWWKYLLP